MQYADDLIRNVLTSVKNVAIVGASPKPDRPAHYVPAFMTHHGYRCIPVNPALAGQTLFGETVYATLAEVPDPVDMVYIFRRSEDAGPFFDQAVGKKAKVVWTPLGVVEPDAAKRAEAAGLTVVMDRCTKIEIPRLDIPPRR
jgi:predicted CoA-binding protein